MPGTPSVLEEAIHARFEEQVRRDSSRMAVRTGTLQLSYGELNHAANGVAAAVLAADLAESEPVAVLLEKGAGAIAAILGVLKAGKIVVPLDPSYARRSIADSIADSRARLILTNRSNWSVAGEVTPDAARLVDLDEVASEAAKPEVSDDVGVRVAPDAPAYILYTSGSTGRAKGVIQTHRNLVHKIAAYTQDLQIRPDDHLSLIHSLGFSASTRNLFGALFNGAAVFPFDLKTEGLNRFSEWLEREHISICHMAASAFRAFAGASTPSHGYPSLRVMYVGNEPVTRHDVELYRTRLSAGCVFVNALAATETGTICQYFVDRAAAPSADTLPVGYPADGVEILVLDENGVQVEDGATGEIAVRSRYNSPGYWGNPELTRAALMPDSTDGASIYRTGDLGRKLADGCLVHLGRKDFQVKIGGLSVDVTAIEDILRSHAEIEDVAVQARHNATDQQHLVAWFVPRQSPGPSSPDLRRFLLESLPAHMIPSAFLMLPVLPKTPNGKVDRRHLPEPPGQRPDLGVAFVAPRTPIESDLAAMWAEQLDLDSVGVHDNFLELGGSSLAGVQIISRVRDAFHVDLAVSAIWEGPTVAELALAILRSEAGQSPIPARSANSLPPLSFAQERLWFLQRWDPENPVYNNVKWIRVDGTLDPCTLENALRMLLDRHQVLRTGFAEIDGRLVQRIEPAADWALGAADLSHLPEAASEMEAERLGREEGLRPFDLDRDPVLRMTLYRISARRHFLLLTVHHIASDGWSMGILLREMATLYETLHKGFAPELSTLPIQYADYAVWQRDGLRGEVHEKQLRYWKNRLAGDLPVLQLPSGRARPASPSSRGATHSFVVPEELIAAARSLARAQSCTLFMLLLAIFKILLHRYTGLEDLIVGSPVSGRNRSELQGLIGCFVNTLALRTDLSGDPTFCETLARVRETCLGAFAHQDLPFEKRVGDLKVVRDLSHTPLFQVMFVFNDAPIPGTIDIPDAVMTVSGFETGTAKFDLLLTVAETGEGLAGTIEYRTDLYEPAMMERLAGHFRTLLEDSVANPDQKIGRLNLLPETERRQLLGAWSGSGTLSAWNQTGASWAGSSCVYQRIEEQAARTPDALAATYANQFLSYSQLNQRANQLARHLQNRGAGPGTRVGLCMVRSLNLLAGLLGIMKSGAAYVPLDPAYPRAWRQGILEDAEISLMVTEETFQDQSVALESTDNLDPSSGPSDAAYVIYTSGSTGEPKGVEIPHGALANALDSLRREPGFTSEDVLLAVTSISFDIAAVELFLPLMTGGRVWIASQSVSADGELLAKLLSESSASVMQATPATWRMLIDSGWAASPVLKAQGFKAWCGGEALPRDLANQLLDRCTCLWNLYGPTETTIWSTISRVTRGEGAVPIGRPIANTEVYVLDPHGQPVPVNVPGELYIGGAGVANGYINRPEWTANSFISPPVPEASSDRLYKTGDLVRYLPDGSLVFLGRLDNQVKLRGYRIELGEVESALSKHPSVSAAVAMVREDTPGDAKLVAYLLAAPRQRPEPDTLRAFLKERLPAQMMPSAFVILDAFPLTGNGKIDRQNLPAPEQNRSKWDPALDHDWDKKAKRLARIWEEVLGVQRVGLHDDFFALGGHSLLAVRLVSKINAAFGVKLPLAILFEAPTVARLAESLRRGTTGKFNSSIIPIKPAGSATPFFLISRFSALGFRALAKHLDAEQPLYGLVPPGPDNGATPISNIEDLATHYIQEMRKVQPRGPYLIGGYSFGGFAAYEVACQIERQGEKTALVFLIDGGVHLLPRYTATLPKSLVWKYRLWHWARGLKFHAQEMLRLSPRHRVRYVFELTGRKRGALRRQITRFDADDTLPHALRAVEHANRTAFHAYLPKPYPGSLTQVRSAKGFTGFDLKRHGWVEFADLETHEIPDSTHLEMLGEPHVARVAEILQQAIERAVSSGSGQ